MPMFCSCGMGGYKPKAVKLAAALELSDGVEVKIAVGRTSSFEVVHKESGTLLYSKLETGAFPVAEEMVEAVKNV